MQLRLLEGQVARAIDEGRGLQASADGDFDLDRAWGSRVQRLFPRRGSAGLGLLGFAPRLFFSPGLGVFRSLLIQFSFELKKATH